MPVDNYTFRYKQPDGGPAAANDITIIFDLQVTVIGVDGVSPTDPGAGFGVVTGDITPAREIKIVRITKSNNQTIIVRAQGTGQTLPIVKRARWTLNGAEIPDALEQLAAVPIDTELDPVIVALDAIEPLMLEIKNLSRRVELLASSAAVPGTFYAR